MSKESFCIMNPGFFCEMEKGRTVQQCKHYKEAYEHLGCDHQMQGGHGTYYCYSDAAQFEQVLEFLKSCYTPQEPKP